LDAISAAFTDAAVDPTRWDAAMDIVSEVTGSFGAALFPFRGPMPGVPRSDSLLRSWERYVDDGWILRDERYAVIPTVLKRGVGTEFDFTTSANIARDPYYQEFLAPLGLRWFAGVKVACGNDVWILSVQHKITQGPFSEKEVRLFVDLSGRLSSAAGLARVLGFAKAAAALEAFQVSGTAAVLVDLHGDVFRANAAAEALIGTDLQIRRRRLLPRDPQARVSLDQALHRLLWLGEGLSLTSPIVLPRITGRPIIAYPLRLTTLAQDALAPARAVVVLIDLACSAVPPERVLRSVLGLTSAEARVAAVLSKGQSLTQAAAMFGVGRETARSQLKAIFAKTRTRHQNELVSLCNRLVWPVQR
jgi:DNA-binding CsgD family transcriptional regulator